MEQTKRADVLCNMAGQSYSLSRGGIKILQFLIEQIPAQIDEQLDPDNKVGYCDEGLVCPWKAG